MGDVRDKVVVVTGSSSGIGKAIALRFGALNARVVVTARRRALCEQVATHIRAAGGQAMVVCTDVREESQVQQLIDETVAQYGRLDILINNAGIFGSAQVASMRTEMFDALIDTNVRGTFLCARAGFRHMMTHGGGVIINMSSVAGVDAWNGTGGYSASKYAIQGLSKALADEGRPYGIKVCTIAPGRVAEDLVDASSQAIRNSENIDPFDIAETAVYLASLGRQATVHQIVVDRVGAEW